MNPIFDLMVNLDDIMIIITQINMQSLMQYNQITLLRNSISRNSSFNHSVIRAVALRTWVAIKYCIRKIDYFELKI